MKIATWNLGYMSPGSHKGKTAEAFKYFFEEIEADFHFFQEGGIEPLNQYEAKCQFERIDYVKGAITGIYSKNHKLEKMVFEKPSLPGSFCCIHTNNVCLTSLYAMTEYLNGQNLIYYMGNLHKIFSDLGSTLWGRGKKFDWYLIGGDFNTDPSYPSNTKLQLDDIQLFEDRVKLFNLFNCNKERGIKDGTYRTNRGNKYQLDYFYLSNHMKDKIRNMHVVDNATVESLSDHYPVIMELDAGWRGR